ncbi:MAG TPA: hypothetical protein PLH19_08335 [Anaerolineae bacterium]|nr:hypothetical protein [Anaerolineae bacterium]HQH38522.1 hypothetical protein [Anaerolineae bacterium]
MTRKQRIVLIILGILDVSVIAALAGSVVHSIRSTPTAPTPAPLYLSACEQSMLNTLAAMPAPLGEMPMVAWDEGNLYVSLRAVYPTATPPEESAQLLWTTLDSMATVLRQGCTIPSTITIALTACGQTETIHYLAQLAGQDMAAWMAGTLSEEDLAAQSHFRQTSE